MQYRFVNESNKAQSTTIHIKVYRCGECCMLSAHLSFVCTPTFSLYPSHSTFSSHDYLPVAEVISQPHVPRSLLRHGQCVWRSKVYPMWLKKCSWFCGRNMAAANVCTDASFHLSYWLIPAWEIWNLIEPFIVESTSAIQERKVVLVFRRSQVW